VDATTKAIDEPIKKEGGKEEPTAKPAAKTEAPPALRIAFKSTETAVPLSMKPPLDALVKQINRNDAARVTVIAYAAAVDGQAGMSRRISLSRALSVRAYLIDAGVSTMRINVQAEGDRNPGGDPDRVDLFIQDSDISKP